MPTRIFFIFEIALITSNVEKLKFSCLLRRNYSDAGRLCSLDIFLFGSSLKIKVKEFNNTITNLSSKKKHVLKFKKKIFIITGTNKIVQTERRHKTCVRHKSQLLY